MNQALHDLGDYVAAAMPRDVVSTDIICDELVISARAGTIIKLLTFLRDDSNCQFRQLVDLCGVDYPDRDIRFEVVYNLLSLTLNQRIRVKITVADGVPVPSVTGVFSGAGWYERETWDLYGIYFSDHPDLRRLLTDYGFEGHPLRKDFPLTGRVEMRYDQAQKRIVYDSVNLTQEYRRFDFMSPWEGMTQDLPGDEKATSGVDENEDGKL